MRGVVLVDTQQARSGDTALSFSGQQQKLRGCVIEREKSLLHKRSIHLILLLCAALWTTLATTACRDAESDELQGDILLWHSWDVSGTETLARLTEEFEAIHPATHVVTIGVPPDDLLNGYKNTARLGLGPDLLLAPNPWIPELVAEDLIRPLPPQDLETFEFIPAAADTLIYEGNSYGLPLTMSPIMLYVNTELAPQPVATLDELLAAAGAEKTVGLNINFDAAYWGIQTMGAGLFSEDGVLQLNASGLEAWLNWLAKARETPGMILTRDDAVLYQMFTEGELAYYIAVPEQLPEFRELLNTQNEDGELVERVAIYPLPAGDEGEAGPIMVTESFLFSPASTAQQAETALALASFLTSAEQGTELMRALELAPASRETRVNSRIYPVSSSVFLQGETAVALPAELDSELWLLAGNAMITAVMSGEMEAQAAMCQFGRTLSEESELEVDLTGCPGESYE